MSFWLLLIKTTAFKLKITFTLLYLVNENSRRKWFNCIERWKDQKKSKCGNLLYKRAWFFLLIYKLFSLEKKTEIRLISKKKCYFEVKFLSIGHGKYFDHKIRNFSIRTFIPLRVTALLSVCFNWVGSPPPTKR